MTHLSSPTSSPSCCKPVYYSVTDWCTSVRHMVPLWIPGSVDVVFRLVRMVSDGRKVIKEFYSCSTHGILFRVYPEPSRIPRPSPRPSVEDIVSEKELQSVGPC